MSIIIVIFLILASLGLIAAAVFSFPAGRAWFSDLFALGSSQTSSSEPLPSRTAHLTHTPRPTRSVVPRTPTGSAPTQAPVVEVTRAPVAAATEAPPPGYSSRGNYTVILRYEKDRVLDGFNGVQNRLEELGYNVSLNEGYGDIGAVDVIQYGSPDCLPTIEDIRQQVGDLLTLPSGEPVRFGSVDASYNSLVIVIQIVDETLFSMY